MRGTVLFALAAALAYPFAPAEAAETKLRAASFQGQEIVFAKPFYRWAAEVNRRCKDKISITVVGPETIEAQRQWYELKNGRIDMYFGPANYYRGALPHGDIFNLAHNSPAVQRKNGAWSILNKLHNEHMNAWYLTTLLSGVKFFIYTTRPAKNGRFDGLHFRSVPLYEGFVRSRGAKVTYMPATDLRAALENGAIQGFGWPLWGLDIFGWDRLVRYRYGPGFMNAAAPILVNLDRWKALTADQRHCLTEMAEWVEKSWPEWRAAEDARQTAVIAKAGITYVDLGPAFAKDPEDIFWRMQKTAEPEFVKKIQPLVE